jgi:hypothetical protein
LSFNIIIINMGKYKLGKIHSKYLIIDILSCPYVDPSDFGR